MTRRSTAFAVLALALAAWAAPRPGRAAAAAVDGAVVYADKCVACHGETGQPTPPFAKRGVRDLSDPAWQKERTDAEIKTSISKGRKDTLMRAFDQELDGDQIDALVKFVRTLDRNKH